MKKKNRYSDHSTQRTIRETVNETGSSLNNESVELRINLQGLMSLENGCLKTRVNRTEDPLCGEDTVRMLNKRWHWFNQSLLLRVYT